MEVRYGRQTPTQSLILPYTTTEGQAAIDLYNSTGRTAQPWQELMLYHILTSNSSPLPQLYGIESSTCGNAKAETSTRGIFAYARKS